MGTKSEQLQIRVAAQQKAALKKAARAAGTDVSSYVLARALPPARERFAALVNLLVNTTGSDLRNILAELHDLLEQCPSTLLADVAWAPPPVQASAHLRNYVAAMVEIAADRKGVQPPAWVADIAPLPVPYFASSMRSLRLHLLRASPVRFKRRNIFVDSTLGDRV